MLRGSPLFFVLASIACHAFAGSGWKKHVLYQGIHSIRTASVGDFTNDGVPDVMASSGGETILLAGPDFKGFVVHDNAKHQFIHSAAMDVDGDGDLDFIGGRHRNPGIIIWFEQSENPMGVQWEARNVSNQLSGVHSLAVADLDEDGKLDLLATSALKSNIWLEQGNTPFPESLAWFRVPNDPKAAKWWRPLIFADRDAPGATHYIGVGDVNQDGRLDAAVGAKVGEYPNGRYFAWWEAPKDRTQPWKKHLIPQMHDGATHIYPADVDRDGQMDFVASRGHSSGVFWLKGPDWKLRMIHAEIDSPHALLVEDMDDDGDIDVATCAFGSQEAWWYENDGKGSFRNHLVTTSQQAYDIRAHDLDGDGDKDLVIAGEKSNNLVWCENPAK